MISRLLQLWFTITVVALCTAFVVLAVFLGEVTL